MEMGCEAEVGLGTTGCRVTGSAGLEGSASLPARGSVPDTSHLPLQARQTPIQECDSDLKNRRFATGTPETAAHTAYHRGW